MQQSIMQFIGQAQQALQVMHGFMHGRQHAIGQAQQSPGIVSTERKSKASLMRNDLQTCSRGRAD